MTRLIVVPGMTRTGGAWDDEIFYDARMTRLIVVPAFPLVIPALVGINIRTFPILVIPT